MIKKLEKHIGTIKAGNITYDAMKSASINEMQEKINEIVDLLNVIVVDVDGTKCIDGSKTPTDPYAEQQKVDWKVVSVLG